MIYKIGICLSLIVMLFSIPVGAQEQKPEARLTLERTACFGACPIYTVTIYDDGTVIYEGERFVEVAGTQTTHIAPIAVETLVTTFEEAGYFDWEDAYTDVTVTDQPLVITSVSRNGETKRIEHYIGDESAPIALTYLENWIDISARTQRWIGQEPALPRFTGAGPVVLTLERTVCFGACPIYWVAVHESGTVVYMGVNFVAETGIHIANIDSEDVAKLAEEMAAEGYFDLNDEYLNYQVTDAPSAITSLSWDGRYKHIRHYQGDLGTPDVLTEIENKIDEVVNTSQWITASGESNTDAEAVNQ
jgi:hypothetical protein